MPIRSARKPPKTGYPDIGFSCFCLRFGHVCVELETAAMRVITGEYARPGIPMKPARLVFYTKPQLQTLIAQREADNQPVQFLLNLIRDWPRSDDERIVHGRMRDTAYKESKPQWTKQSITKSESPTPKETAKSLPKVKRSVRLPGRSSRLSLKRVGS